MHYVLSGTMLVEMTDHNYAFYLQSVVDGEEWPLTKFGKALGHVEDVSALGPEGAEDKLSWLKAKTGMKYFSENGRVKA